ncbi:MAG: LuxR C-terminal-related transcriptional regulator [Myxococcales bacterium]
MNFYGSWSNLRVRQSLLAGRNAPCGGCVLFSNARTDIAAKTNDHGSGKPSYAVNPTRRLSRQGYKARMPLESKKGDYLAIVENCYEVQANDERWIGDVLDSMRSVFDLGGGLTFTLYQELGDRAKAVTLSTRGVSSLFHRIGVPAVERFRGESYERYFYPRQPVTLASPIIAKMGRPAQLAFRAACNAVGADDLLGMLGYPAPGWIFAVGLIVGRGREVTPAVRSTLHRIRIHLEAGERLRLLAPEHAVAVLSSEGKLLHLQKPLGEDVGFEPLVQQTKIISRLRTKRERFKDDALKVWNALVEGEWSVVERVDTDGKRLYFAFENAPQSRAYRALTPREATVLDQSIQGLPGKYVAYSTGLRSSRVSEHLLSAANKLGFRTRHDLLRVASALRATRRYHLLAGNLTASEQEVLRLVKLGLSNREIAGERKTSIWTIANQVASLLRKTGVDGRRGLVAVEVGVEKQEHGPTSLRR